MKLPNEVGILISILPFPFSDDEIVHRVEITFLRQNWGFTRLNKMKN